MSNSMCEHGVITGGVGAKHCPECSNNSLIRQFMAHSAPAPRDAESEPRPVYASAEHPAETSEIWAAIAAWANASTGEAEIEAANRINAHLAAARTEIAAQSAEVARLREANAALEQDKARLDWLEGEEAREWEEIKFSSYRRPLFRGNNPITRATIDAERAARSPSQA